MCRGKTRQGAQIRSQRRVRTHTRANNMKIEREQKENKFEHIQQQQHRKKQICTKIDINKLNVDSSFSVF